MSNLAELLAHVKRAAVEAVHAEKPFALLRGTVTDVSPLKIQIDQKLEIPTQQIILTNAVRDYKVELADENGTKKMYTVNLALKKGEAVLLVRADGGQRFIVLDRVEALS